MSGDENFLSRWSRRKVEARAAKPAEPAAPSEAPAQASPAPPVAPAATAEAAVARPELPPVESLTPDSDYSPFMARDVDDSVRRQALRKLFTDPRLGVVDMLDVYMEDFGKPDPLPASWLAKLDQVSGLGDKAGRDREEAERARQAARDAEESSQAAASGGTGEPTTAPGVASAPAEDEDSGGGPEIGGLPAPDRRGPDRA